MDQNPNVTVEQKTTNNRISNYQMIQIYNTETTLPGISDSNFRDFLIDSTDRPLPRFQPGNSPVSGIDDEIGIGDNVGATVPSGPYFLGLPLLFFPSVAPAVGTLAGGCGGGVSPSVLEFSGLESIIPKLSGAWLTFTANPKSTPPSFSSIFTVREKKKMCSKAKVHKR